MLPFDCGARTDRNAVSQGTTALEARDEPRDYAKWSTLSYGFALEISESATGLTNEPNSTGRTYLNRASQPDRGLLHPAVADPPDEADHGRSDRED